MRMREKSLDKKLSSIEYVMNGPFFGSQSLSSILAVLPSGVHGLSPTGLPSPLLDRWRSGGSCDCGGWDLGCQLRVLSNHDQRAKKLDSTTLSCGQEKFDI
ncbi:hypothetical protein IFM89_030994 [Coptis chinensis]|uniref:Uncharacterized protein n=1 Tax=Coptis chinensis TaxID=261450 RepID=A0A835H9Y1_9MAGN|nr:hypothetical protein IFM89_030994 [Coptis chinensis]